VVSARFVIVHYSNKLENIRMQTENTSLLHQTVAIAPILCPWCS